MIPTVKLVDENTTHPKTRAIFDDIKATKKISKSKAALAPAGSSSAATPWQLSR